MKRKCLAIGIILLYAGTGILSASYTNPLRKIALHPKESLIYNPYQQQDDLIYDRGYFYGCCVYDPSGEHPFGLITLDTPDAVDSYPGPQNARLGMAGLGDLSAPQAALWTWAEALGEELRASPGDVRITMVAPPRVAPATQRLVSERSGRTATLRPPRPGPLVAAILAGRRRAGRRPVVAALALLR